MNKKSHEFLLALMLIIISITMYCLHYAIFRNSGHIYLYLIGDLAFLPLEVLFVSLIFNKAIEDKQKKDNLRKLNMIIGVFFSEMGTDLVKTLISSDKNIKNLENNLIILNKWTKSDFQNAYNAINKHKPNISFSSFQDLKLYLAGNKEFMLKIIENQSLLEHELFSELLLALFHLQDELSSRDNIEELSKKDEEHIIIDTLRVYSMILKEWLLYMQHLKGQYPYLFSMAIRTNPFDKDAKIEII